MARGKSGTTDTNSSGINLGALAGYNPAGVMDGVTAEQFAASYTGPTATQNADGSFTWHDPVTGGVTPDSGKKDTPAVPTEAEAAESRRRAATEAAVKAAFSMYGLSSLYPKIEEWSRQGLTDDAIYLNLRGTAEYKARFPAMEALSAKGRAMTEAQYVNYEQTAAALEQRYGYPQGMVSGQVTTLLTNDVGLPELQDRLVLASADSITAPQDLRDTITTYFNINPDTALKAYYLDPDVAMPVLEKQSAIARIGVNAARQGVAGVGVGLATELQGQGVTEAQAKQGFGKVAAAGEFTAGRGETTDTTGLTRGVFGNADEAAKTQRIAQSRTGAFGASGGFAETKTGVAGLGSASQ